MSSYRIAEDHDVALGSLTVLNPQPRSTGVWPTRRTYTGNGVIDEGLYTEWIFDGGIDDAAHYADILQDSGLLNISVWRPVTIYTRNEIFAWRRYNGMAVRPEPVWENYFPRLVLLIRDLQELGL